MVDYTGASPVAGIRGKHSFGPRRVWFGKPWNGPGITSSTAAQVNSTAARFAIGGLCRELAFAVGSVRQLPRSGGGSTSVLIAYTRTADATLDGVVNNDDVTVVGANYAPGAAKPAWALGDFEFNGSVDNDDVTLLGMFYTGQPGTCATRGQSPGRAGGFLVSRGCHCWLVQQCRCCGRISCCGTVSRPCHAPRPKVSSLPGQRRPSVQRRCGVRHSANLFEPEPQSRRQRSGDPRTTDRRRKPR